MKGLYTPIAVCGELDPRAEYATAVHQHQGGALYDEVFPIRKDWIDEFAEKWPARVGIPFEVLVDPRMVTLDLQKLKSAGLRALGGHSGNDRVILSTITGQCQRKNC